MATSVGLGTKKKKKNEITELKAKNAKLEEKIEEAEKAKAILISENEELKTEIAKLKNKN